MTLDYSLLDPTFLPLAQQLVQAMTAKGYTVNPYYGIRTLAQSAALWRQSRSTAVVNAQIQAYNDAGCTFLANVMQNVGPSSGPWASNALPGQSYHNYGLAMDCLLTPDAESDYKVYADTAQSLGLTAGYYFSDQDMGHVQLGSSDIPFNYTMQQINDHFQNI